MVSEYLPDGHEFVFMEYISSHPHSSANNVIDATGMNSDDAFRALDELKKQGVVLPDEKMQTIDLKNGLGIVQIRTYIINSNHPNINKSMLSK